MDSTVRHSEKPFGTDHGLIHEAVVTGRKVGAGEDFWKALAHDEAAFRRALSAVMQVQTSSSTPVSIAEAATIMGDHFLGLDALKRVFGFTPNAKQKKAFEAVSCSAEVLQACRDTHALVAVAPLSLMDVWKSNPTLFYSKNDPWFKGERFATTKVEAGFYLVRLDPVPNSTSKTWDEQCQLLGSDEEVSSASVLAQTYLLTYLVLQRRLFEKLYVRVSDVGSGGGRVRLGGSGRGGLGVYGGGWGSGRGGGLGLSAVRKLS